MLLATMNGLHDHKSLLNLHQICVILRGATPNIFRPQFRLGANSFVQVLTTFPNPFRKRKGLMLVCENYIAKQKNNHQSSHSCPSTLTLFLRKTAAFSRRVRADC